MYNYLNFNQISEEQLKLKSYEIVDLISKDKKIDEGDLLKAKDFFYLFNKYRNFSTLYEHLNDINNHPGKDIFINLSKGSNYYPWIIDVLTNTDREIKDFVIEF